MIGQRPNPAEMTLAQMRRLENALSETGGSFSVRNVDSHVSYVATMPLRPVLDEAGASGDMAHATLDGKTIMVLDDQEEARDALEAVLESAVAHVMLCASGEEALTRSL